MCILCEKVAENNRLIYALMWIEHLCKETKEIGSSACTCGEDWGLHRSEMGISFISVFGWCFNIMP